MDSVKVLIEGYAYPSESGSFFASPTTSLITTSDKKILVDPGANEQKLLDALSQDNLIPEDIDIVYLTHYHPDHFLNIRLFPNKDIYDGSTLWKNTGEEIFYSSKVPGTDIEILPTPGHSAEHSSLIINTKDGVVVIAEDVFWWKDGLQVTDSYESLINTEDEFASDFEALKESRKKVLQIADWVIPGHGKMFKNQFKNLNL
jgi:glyoxylase-like metal-dependent hydrolase (beta-lactamase superfamily II)